MIIIEMIRIFTFILMSNIMWSCSVAPGFKFATFKEQIDMAGLIVIGTVTNVTNQFDAEVTLNQTSYYRGCGGATIKIKRFVQSATCGSGIPQIGDKIIVFACADKNDNFNSFKVNQFVPYTGWVAHSFAKENEVKSITGIWNPPIKCRCARTYERCLNRNTAGTCPNIFVPPVFKIPIFNYNFLNPLFKNLNNNLGNPKPIPKPTPVLKLAPVLPYYKFNNQNFGILKAQKTS